MFNCVKEPHFPIFRGGGGGAAIHKETQRHYETAMFCPVLVSSPGNGVI